MAVFSSPTSGGGDDPASLARTVKALVSTVQQYQTQNNSAPGYFSPQGGRIAGGVPPGSMNARSLSDGSIALSIASASGFGGEVVIGGQAPDSSNYLAPQTHSGAPTTTQFPSSGNFGWYKNTTTGNWYFTLNSGGTIVFQAISTLSGSITAAQHGAQTDQTLHAVSTSTTNGFMTAAQFNTLAANTTNIASIQTTVTDITSTGTVSELLNGSQIQVNGTKVVGARSTGWTTGGTFTSTKALTINTATITTQQTADLLYTLYTALSSHGLIGT